MALKGLRFTLDVDGLEANTFAVVRFGLTQHYFTKIIPLKNFIKKNEHVLAHINATYLKHNILIGNKFLKDPLTGPDSRQATLMAKDGDDRTMTNAYNIEKYFE